MACQNLLNAHGESIDQLIWTHAEKNKKQLDGLESVQEQIEVLLAMSIEFEYRQLRNLAFNIKKTRRSLEKLLLDYKNQKIRALFKKTIKSLGPNKSLLLTSRNARFADRIFKIHKAESSFICFGAGHLAGKYGVLNLLKQQGAILKPIKILS
jgi:uncharacterized protein YbaP (TraB family)